MPTPRETPTLAEVRKWPATVSIGKAATALGVASSTLYDLVRRGASPVKVLSLGATRKQVLTTSIVRVLEGADG
jgi:hypothetical protein